MVYTKKSTAQTSRKDAKNTLERLAEEEQLASDARRIKRGTGSTQKGTGGTSGGELAERNKSPLADEQSDQEGMTPAPIQASRKSRRKIQPTERVMAGLRPNPTAKPKATRPPPKATKSEATKSKATGKEDLGTADSNRGNAEEQSAKGPQRRYHGAKENSPMVLEPFTPHSGGREADLERENDELKRWLALFDILMQYSPSCIGIIRSLKAQASSEKKKDTDGTITKRTGSVGNKGYKLRVSMELDHDKDLYKRILVSITFGAK